MPRPDRGQVAPSLPQGDVQAQSGHRGRFGDGDDLRVGGQPFSERGQPQLRQWFSWCESNALDPLVGIQRALVLAVAVLTRAACPVPIPKSSQQRPASPGMASTQSFSRGGSAILGPLERDPGAP